MSLSPLLFGRALRHLLGRNLLVLLMCLGSLQARAATFVPTTWDCGGEGEQPCGCLTDFFWENGNLFADRGLVATGFRVLTPVKFNSTDWVNLNRADMTLAVDLINVRIPALKARVGKLTVNDFVRKQCIGVEQGGQCWITPPTKVRVYGKKILGECVPWFESSDCDSIETVPGVPSFSFDYFPDFSKGGWSTVDELKRLMPDIQRVMAQFPGVVQGIPGTLPTVDFKIPNVNEVLNFGSFKSSVDSLALFFARSSLFFDNFRSLILDFTEPPATAKCVDSTRRQSEPAAFMRTWAHWAFANQRELGKDEPFNWSTRLGTHNAFNNEADGYLAANQKWSITDQLNLGARYVSLDVHWFQTGLGKLRLSHAQTDHTGASGLDRFYANGIKEIARWLNDNPREVVHISFEDRSAGAPNAAVTDPLEKYLGNKIYRRVEGNRPWRNGNYDPVGQWPSLQQFRDLGKQVIIDADAHDSNALWTDMPAPKGGLGASQAKNFSGDFQALKATASGALIGPFDDTRAGTQYESRSWLDPFESAGFLTAAGIAERVPYNISLLNLDMLHAQQYSSQCPDAGSAVCGSPDGRIAAMVWSWKQGQPEDVLQGPDNGEDSALFEGTSGRWESRKPSEVHFFACAHPRGLDPLQLRDRPGVDWRITEQSGPWVDGDAAVAALNRTLRSNGLDDDADGQVDEEDEGDYVFSAPANAGQNERLKRALAAFRLTRNLPDADVWLACHDRLAPGRWMLSRSFPDQDSSVHPGSLAFNGTGGIQVDGYRQIIPMQDITIEFWQKADQNNPQSTFSMSAEPFGDGLSIQTPAADGQVYWDFGAVFGEPSGRLAYTPPIGITGSWQHFAMVASRSKGQMKIFRNGVEEASRNEVSPFPPFTQIAWPLHIGNGFKGRLDDIRVWSVARNASEIRETMFRRLSGQEPGLVSNWKLDEESGTGVTDSVLGNKARRSGTEQWVTIKPGTSDAWSSYVISQSPLLYHRLDERAGATTATDLSGRAFHGTYVGASMEQPSASPHLGRSIGLSTAGGGHVQLRNLGSLDQVTLSLWVNPLDGTGVKPLFNSGTGPGALSIEMLAGGTLQVSVQGNAPAATVLIPGAIPQAGVWHHLTLTYDSKATPGVLRVKVDGITLAEQLFSIAQRARFDAPSLGRLSTSPLSGTPFVIRGRGGINGTATLGGVTFDSIASGGLGSSGRVKVTHAGNLENLGAPWRTRSAPKALDVDQDNILGTDGYQLVNLPPSLPPYVSGTGPLTGTYPGNPSYAVLDDPQAQGAGFLTGTQNPFPGPGNSADLFSFSLTPGSWGRTIRVGLLVDNLDGQEWNASELEVAHSVVGGPAGTPLSTSSPALNNRVPDWIFFDIVGAGRQPDVGLDEFVLFPRAFSDSEIQALHQNAPDGMFLSFTPAPGQVNVSSNLIRVVHLQGTVKWEPSQVTLRLDGKAVEARVESEGGRVSVSHLSPEPFLPGSKHSVSLTYPSGGASTLTRSWQFTMEPGSLDVVRGRLGVFTGAAAFTPDGGGRSGAPGDRAVDLGKTQTAQSVHIRDVGFLNEAAAGDEMAIGGWQKLHAVTSSAFFWGISPSSTGGQRGWGTHSPWGDNTVYFDTAGCCDGTQRTAESIYNFPFYPNPEDPGYWNGWHHLVFQKRQATKEIWIDGHLLVRAQNPAALPTDFTSAFIGYNATDGGSLEGVVDDLAVFRKFLSPEDIARLASGTPPTALPQSAGLIALWNFDDLGGSKPVTVQAVAQPGGILLLSWSAGSGPVAIQRRASLVDGTWDTLTTTEASSAEVAIQGGSAFFRVISQ